MDMDMIKACQEEAQKVQQAVIEMRMLVEDQEIPESQLEARKKHLELRVQQHCQKIVERAHEEVLRLRREAEKFEGKSNAESGNKEDVGHELDRRYMHKMEKF